MQAEVGPAVGSQLFWGLSLAESKAELRGTLGGCWEMLAKFRFSQYLIATDFPRTEKPQLGQPFFPCWSLGWGRESLAENPPLKPS